MTSAKQNEPSSIDIITGPPGAGKLVHVYRTQRTSPIYCCYHHNKKYADQSTHPHIVLLAYSSSKFAKQHWLDQAALWGRTPTLYVINPPMDEALDRMQRRPRDNTLFKEIEYWYRTFTPHPGENVLTLSPGDESKVYT